MADTDFLGEPEDNPFFGDLAAPEPDAPEPDAPVGPSPDEMQRLQQQAQMVQRFYSDPAFARQVLQERAQQLGLALQEPRAEPQRPQAPPTDYVELVKGTLTPELQFLAPQIAAATWAATQASIAPVLQQQRQQREEQHNSHFEAMAEELARDDPNWARYEDDMLQILAILKGEQGTRAHPKFGSALKMLYRLASGDARATVEAGRRMGEAVRAQTRGSTAATRSTGPDLQTLIDRAPTRQQQWQLAMREALREHGAM